MLALGEKTVNQRKQELVCKHVIMDKAVKILYCATKWYNRSSNLGGYFNETL